MKVAVTGGAGQLGTLVLRRLLDDDAFDEVLCLDMRPPSLVNDKLSFVEADVRDEKIGEHLVGFDGLFHLAFIVTQKVDPHLYEAVNVGGSRNVFTRASDAGVKHFVYASSIAAYGVVDGHPEPIVEATPRIHQPEFPYSSCKYQVEAFLDEFTAVRTEVTVARMRPAILVGTHFQNPGAKMLGRLFDGGRIAEVSANAPPLPLVWDEDVADAAVTMMRTKADGPFILSADDQLNAEGLAKAAGLKLVRPPAWVLRGLGAVSPILERLGLAEAVDPSWQQEGNAKMVLSAKHAVDSLEWNRRCPTCADVVRHYVEQAPGKTDPRVVAFGRKVAVGSRRVDKGMDGAVHLSITGRGGADYRADIVDGNVRLESGMPRPPIATVTVSVEDLLALMADEQDSFDDRVRFDGSDAGRIVLRELRRRWRTNESPGLRERARDWLRGSV